MLKRTAKFVAIVAVVGVILVSVYLNFVTWFNGYSQAVYNKGALDAQSQIVQGLMTEVKKGDVTLSNGKETIIIVDKATYGGLKTK